MRNIQISTLLFVFSFISINAISQDCFEFKMDLTKEIQSKKRQRFQIIEENDSIQKILWWNRGELNEKQYSSKFITVQIVKTKPSEFISDGITFRGHAISNDLYIDGKKIDFYTFCD